MSELKHQLQMEKSIKQLFFDAWKNSFRNPRLGLFLNRFRTVQKKAAAKRLLLKQQQDTIVPPFMILSITKQCNLQCTGCYARENQKKESGNELNKDEIISVLKQAGDIGVSIVLIAGGEPFMRKDLLEMTAEFPNILFPVFTNGLSINKILAKEIKKQPHVIPVLSLEGEEEDTNQRRGENVQQDVLDAMKILKKQGSFFGTSFTVTKNNLNTITSGDYIKRLKKEGSKLFFYNEYVPFQPGTESLCLNDEKRKILDSRLTDLRIKESALFISFPGDEEEYGGCMSAGRGFFHINSVGDVEPCPFAPYSQSSVRNMSLLEALQSPLLKAIRDNHEELTETSGGCALWNKKEWVEGLLSENNDLSKEKIGETDKSAVTGN